MPILIGLLRSGGIIVVAPMMIAGTLLVIGGIIHAFKK